MNVVSNHKTNRPAITMPRGVGRGGGEDTFKGREGIKTPAFSLVLIFFPMQSQLGSCNRHGHEDIGRFDNVNQFALLSPPSRPRKFLMALATLPSLHSKPIPLHKPVPRLASLCLTSQGEGSQVIIPTHTVVTHAATHTHANGVFQFFVCLFLVYATITCDKKWTIWRRNKVSRKNKT